MSHFFTFQKSEFLQFFKIYFPVAWNNTRKKKEEEEEEQIPRIESRFLSVKETLQLNRCIVVQSLFSNQFLLFLFLQRRVESGANRKYNE